MYPSISLGGRKKYTFKVVVLAVISIRRMKYLVKKYHRNLHKSSPQYQFKEKTRNPSASSKKKGVENVIDEDETSPVHQIKDTTGGRNVPHSSTIKTPKKHSPRAGTRSSKYGSSHHSTDTPTQTHKHN